MPDKQQAWNDLHRLTNDESSGVRASAASALGDAFSEVPDKQQAWSDLIRLTNDEDSSVRFRAASAFDSVFSDNPDKQQVWSDLHKPVNDEDSSVRASAAEALRSAFFQVPDKRQAWNDLHRLTNDDNFIVRYNAAEALGSTFSQLPDKQQASDNLIKLTKDKGRDVPRRWLTDPLDDVYLYLPKKRLVVPDYQIVSTKEIIRDTNRKVKNCEGNDQDQVQRRIEELLSVLKLKISPIPENKEILDRIEEMRSEKDIIKQYEILSTIISLVPTVHIREKAVEEDLVREKAKEESVKRKAREDIEALVREKAKQQEVRARREASSKEEESIRRKAREEFLFREKAEQQEVRARRTVVGEECSVGRKNILFRNTYLLIKFIFVFSAIYFLLLKFKMINSSAEWTYLAIITSLLFFVYQKLKHEGY